MSAEAIFQNSSFVFEKHFFKTENSPIIVNEIDKYLTIARLQISIVILLVN